MTLERTGERSIPHAPQYPNADEFFAGTENPDPYLVAAYNAYTTTSPLRKRDPGILAETIFHDEIAGRQMTRGDAQKAFGALTKELEPTLRAAGLIVAREKRPKKDELVYLEPRYEAPDELPTEPVDTTGERVISGFAGVEFPEGTEFPTIDEANSAVVNRTKANSVQREIADIVLSDYSNGLTTKASRLLGTVLPPQEIPGANNLLSAHRFALNRNLINEGVALGRIKAPKSTDEAEYTYVRAGSVESVPVGKRIETPVTPPPTPPRTEDAPRGNANRSNSDSRKAVESLPTQNTKGQEYIDFPDPENKVILLEDLQLDENVRFATPEEIEIAIARFRPDSKTRSLAQFIAEEQAVGRLGFIRPGAIRVFPDMDIGKGSMNFATATININRTLGDTGTQIAALRVPARRNEAGMFYALVRVETDSNVDLKQVMQWKALKSLSTSNPPSMTVENPTAPADSQTHPQDVDEDDFIIPDTTDNAQVAWDLDDAATINTPDVRPATTEQNERVFYDSVLTNKEIAMITTLFGTRESAKLIDHISQDISPGRKRNRGLLRGAIVALQEFQADLLDGSLVGIVEATPDNSNIFNRKFSLKYPEDWDLDQVLSYVFGLREKQERLDEEVHETAGSEPTTDALGTPEDFEMSNLLEQEEMGMTSEDSVGGILNDGVEVSLSAPSHVPEDTPIPTAGLESEDGDYPNVSVSAQKIITALFGRGDRTHVKLGVIAEHMREGRKVRNEHLQSALLSVGNVALPEDSVVKIIPTSSGRLDAYSYRLDYPQDWSLEQVLEYLNNQTAPRVSGGIAQIQAAAPQPVERRPYVELPLREITETPPPQPQSPASPSSEPRRTTYNEFTGLFENGRGRREPIPNAPTIQLDLEKMEWHKDGKSGKIPFGELVHLLARFTKAGDSLDRFALAGLKPGDQNQKALDLGQRNFLNLQKLLDDPDKPQIFTSTGNGRYATYRMIANVQIL